jgi:hypothetical protein
VLAENRDRWESLTEADRERVELLAATIAKRLLQQPILHLKAGSDDHATYEYIQALRELFGLETEVDSAFAGPSENTEPQAEVTPLRRRRARGRT